MAERHFFEFLRVFIRSDVHAVRAGIKLKGQPPLNNPRVFRHSEASVSLRGLFDALLKSAQAWFTAVVFVL